MPFQASDKRRDFYQQQNNCCAAQKKADATPCSTSINWRTNGMEGRFFPKTDFVVLCIFIFQSMGELILEAYHGFGKIAKRIPLC